jgi:hypothetical protein
MNDMKKTIQTSQLRTLAKQICDAHDAVTNAFISIPERAHACGRALLEVKELLKHGEWLPWLEANCPGLSESTAKRYMRVAKSVTVTDLNLPKTIKELYEAAGVYSQNQPRQLTAPPLPEPVQNGAHDAYVGRTNPSPAQPARTMADAYLSTPNRVVVEQNKPTITMDAYCSGPPRTEDKIDSAVILARKDEESEPMEKVLPAVKPIDTALVTRIAFPQNNGRPMNFPDPTDADLLLDLEKLEECVIEKVTAIEKRGIAQSEVTKRLDRIRQYLQCRGRL